MPGSPADVRAGGGATAIQIPVPQPERDHVGGPDHRAGRQQTGRVGGKELVVSEDVADEAGGGEQIRQCLSRAITALVVTRSQVFCRSMRPGSPTMSAASNASRTTGSTPGGFTRYLAGSATCRPTTTMIASATGHQCSPRSAARSGVTGAKAARSWPEARSPCGLGGQAVNPGGPRPPVVVEGDVARPRPVAIVT